MNSIIKYPRTIHLEGSGIQKGDKKTYYPIEKLVGKYVVIEEKVDGSNVGISFDSDQNLFLQSRGHYLIGHPREFHFSYFKQWANERRYILWSILGDRYILYAEYMFATHSIFYNSLTSYIQEFDIFDKKEQYFLSTKQRQKLLENYREYGIVSVPILYSGVMKNANLESFITMSEYCDENIANDFKKAYLDSNNKLPIEDIAKGIDNNGVMEGLYVKEEDDKKVLNRFKYVRSEFVQKMVDNDNHGMNRTLIKNKLADNG